MGYDDNIDNLNQLILMDILIWVFIFYIITCICSNPNFTWDVAKTSVKIFLWIIIIMLLLSLILFFIFGDDDGGQGQKCNKKKKIVIKEMQNYDEEIEYDECGECEENEN